MATLDRNLRSHCSCALAGARSHSDIALIVRLVSRVIHGDKGERYFMQAVHPAIGPALGDGGYPNLCPEGSGPRRDPRFRRGTLPFAFLELRLKRRLHFCELLLKGAQFFGERFI